ncbi:MAG: OmpA/MotB family protein [Desulforhopalus sp.]
MAQDNEHSARRRPRARNFPISPPSWMVTYADLITLLLTFFILLLSMANLDPVRFTKASSSLKDAFGIHRDPAQVNFTLPVLPSPLSTRFSPIRQQTTENVYEKVRSQIDALRLNESVGLLKKDAESIILRINDSVLFAPGQAQLSHRSFPLLRRIADIIEPLPMDLRIEGHTDGGAIPESQFNLWELSVDRSLSVLRFYAKSKLIALDRMAAIGYGGEKPLRPNSDEKSRSLNRRVDFVLRLQGNLSAKRGAESPDEFPL